MADMESLKSKPIERNLKIKSIECSLCNKSFTKISNLNSHVANVHDKKKNHKCLKCGKMFFKLSNLKDHNAVHEGIRFKCDECSMDFSRKYDLKKHVTMKHNCTEMLEEPKVTYSLCKKSFVRNSSLNTHLEFLDSKMKSFSCSMCKKSFTIKYSLNTHIANVHERKKNYKCLKCGKSFFKLSNLKDHNDVHEGIKKFKCEQCTKDFTRKYYLKCHVETTHGISKVLKLDDKVNSKISKINEDFKCDACEKLFNNRLSLKKHYMLNHNGNKKYKCELCPSVFGQKVHLDIHVERKHFNSPNDEPDGKLNKPASEETLGRSAMSQEKPNGVLQNHISNAENKIQESGEVNISENAKDSVLTLEIENDTSRPETDNHFKNYECDICGENFEKDFHCRNHLETVHMANKNDVTVSMNSLELDNEKVVMKYKGKNYKCKFCRKTLNKISDLQDHVISQHLEEIIIIEPSEDNVKKQLITKQKSNRYTKRYISL